MSSHFRRENELGALLNFCDFIYEKQIAKYCALLVFLTSYNAISKMGKLRRIRHFKIELKWAIIYTIMFLVWTLLEKTLGWHEGDIANKQWLTLFFIPFAIAMYWLAMKETRRRVYKRVITWRQCFMSGVLMAIFVALLSPIAVYIIQNFITPENFETVANHSVTNNLLKIEQANNLLNIDNYRWQTAIGAFVIGVITSFISASILKTVNGATTSADS